MSQTAALDVVRDGPSRAAIRGNDEHETGASTWPPLGNFQWPLTPGDLGDESGLLAEQVGCWPVVVEPAVGDALVAEVLLDEGGMRGALDLRSLALRGFGRSAFVGGVDECEVEGGVEQVLDVGFMGDGDLAELDEGIGP